MGAEGAARSCQTLPADWPTSAPTSRIRLSSNVVIDRDTASRLGLTAQAVDAALYDAFGQRQVSTMYKSIQPVPRGAGVEQQWWESPDFLEYDLRADAERASTFR